VRTLLRAKIGELMMKLESAEHRQITAF